MANGSMLITVLLCISIQIAGACYSSGICGGLTGGYGCTVPVAPACSGGCSPGYACGQYGCYARARARSPKILEDLSNDEPSRVNDDVDHPLTTTNRKLNSEETTDEQFYECCVNRQLPDSCLQKCSYAAYTKDSLQKMYLRMDKCPITALADISYCAASGMDHTECCTRNGVATTLAGRKCLTFCDQRPGKVTKLDLTYLPCYNRFENIKQCFMIGSDEKNRPAYVNERLARTFES